MTISVAMVGAGRMGAKHVAALAAMDDVRVVGVADVRPEAASALAAERGAETFTDYREMLERIKPDVAYFCTPPADHGEQLVFAAGLGVNMFVEKPLASSMVDANAIVDAVERAGVLFTVGYQWRHNPAADVARETLGEQPATLLAGWWYWTIPPIPWIADRRYGGGQVFEQATHQIDLMRFLGGDIQEVYAVYAQNARPESELPNWDANAVTMRFASGAAGSLHTTYALFPGIPNGNAVDIIARELLIRSQSARCTVFRRDQEPVETKGPEGWTIDQPFMEAVRRNDPNLIRSPAGDSAKSIAVSLAANYSAVTGKVVDVETFMADPPTDAAIMPTG